MVVGFEIDLDHTEKWKLEFCSSIRGINEGSVEMALGVRNYGNEYRQAHVIEG